MARTEVKRMDINQPTLTFLLSRWNDGDREAGEEVMAKAYDPLRELARRFFAGERPDHTLQPTALVHEVYLALVERRDVQNRKHFFGLAGCMMRSLLVDQSRRRKSLKRGGDRQRVKLDGLDGAVEPNTPPEDLLALSQALEQLAAIDPQKAAIVEQRYFAGLTAREIASNLALTERTVGREWRRAKAWLYTALEPEHRDVL